LKNVEVKPTEIKPIEVKPNEEEDKFTTALKLAASG